ncbi:MAG: DinB family protein [Chloroflexota bacterium]|nr:MAG: DinB family protein [Chloroflexota bacterium]
MSLRIGIENGAEGRTIFWVLDHPGCFAYGKDQPAARAALPSAVQEYNTWLANHGQELRSIAGTDDIQIDSTWEVYTIDKNFILAREGYEVNAWFQDDWRPLTDLEIKMGITLLKMTRADLLSSVEGVSEEVMNQKFPKERWSIAGILRHVSNADWWYLDRLGLAFPSDQVPAEIPARLAMVREFMLGTIPQLSGSKLVIGIDGEFWSPRKLLRRAVWHERDHTFHIRKLLGA